MVGDRSPILVKPLLEAPVTAALMALSTKTRSVLIASIIQAKRYADSNTVGAGAIRNFFGSLDRFKASKGLFVTASTFSSSARETAAQLSKRIVLIDGEQVEWNNYRHNFSNRAGLVAMYRTVC